MQPPLSSDEVRILGALIEKEITTPEYYPLSLNALTNACNQKSNRFPVVAFDDHRTDGLLEGLRDKRLVAMVTGTSNRVPKFKQLLAETIGLDGKDTAVMCELMLRGPQTAAQLRAHAARLHPFEGLPEVEAVLQGLVERPQGPLVVKLPRQPGHKEQRYAHLLAGPPAPPEALASPAPAEKEDSQGADTLEQLRAEVSSLRAEVEELRQRVTAMHPPPPVPS
ncbi:MAG: YceH family protein [Kiritimatiellae bacterium]|nr:YceH family protein [Kiritimatiellia bacterium]